MKKNSIEHRFDLQEWLKKLVPLVFAALLVCGGLSRAQAGSVTDEEKVSFPKRELTVEQVFDAIMKQLRYEVFYSENELHAKRLVALPREEMELTEVLNFVLEDKFTYTITGRTIVIRPAVKREPEKERRVAGVVKDEEGNPLSGVSVLIKGTTLGVSTNVKGQYTIVIPRSVKNPHLLFSFVGMESVTLPATRDSIDVTLKMDVQQMEEVVVRTGYENIDKRKLTSSVVTVKMEDIIRPGVSTIDQLLEGQIPDLVLMTNSGEIGVVPKLRIRGTSTLIGNREPLWVVDGIIQQDPVDISPEELNDPDFITRVGNAISGLNPMDIERIDVLKDAAATALYGTRAANGVIVITTKKGRIGDPIISYSFSGTVKLRPRYSDRKIDLMNSKERVNFSRELMEQKYTFPSDMALVGYEYLFAQLYNKEISFAELQEEIGKMETRNTDWFKILGSDAFSHSHTLSVSGGSQDIRYYVSLGYTDEDDVIRVNKNNRYTVAANLNMVFGEHLTAFVSLNGNKSEREYYQSEIAPIDYAYNTSRTIPVYNDDHSLYFYKLPANYTDAFPYADYNILNELENSSSIQNQSSISVNANITWNPVLWLRANVIGSYQISNTDQESYWGAKTKHVALMRLAEYGEMQEERTGLVTLPSGGELTRSFTRTESYMFRLQLDMNHSFGQDKQHFINGSFGFEAYSTRTEGYSRTDRGYDPDRGFQFTTYPVGQYSGYDDWLVAAKPSISNDLTNTVAAYATISYSYKNWLNLNLNGRYDGSNRFGSQSNDKLLPVWSASLSYNPIECFGGIAFFDYLSLKFSYGYQGNMLDDQSPELIIQKLPLDTYFNAYASEVAIYPNPELKWEQTNSINGGLEFSVFDNALMVSGDVYYKKTKDAFQERNISRVNGRNAYTVNSGEITNKGWSVSLTASPIQTRNVRWSISTSYSNVFNKVDTESATDAYSLDNFLRGTAVVGGETVNTFYSYKFTGLNPKDGGPMFDDGADRYQELAGKSQYEVYTNVLTPSGKREPTMTGGLNNTIRIYNLRINFYLSYAFGAKTRLFKVYGGDIDNFASDRNINRIFLDRWQRPGDEEFTNVPAIMSTDSDAYKKYNSHWSTSTAYNVPTIADSYWDMYNYSDIRVVNANYLKCTSLSFTYSFPERWLTEWGLQRLDLSFSTGNPFTITSKDLKGMTPTQGGFTDIQMSERPNFSFGINLSF